MNADVTKPSNPYRFRLFAVLLPLVAHLILLALLFMHQEPPIPPQKALLKVQTVQLGKPAAAPLIKQEALPLPLPAAPVQEEPLAEASHEEDPEPVAPQDDVSEKKPVKKEAKTEAPPAKPKKEAKTKPTGKKEEKKTKKEASPSKKESSSTKSPPKKEKTTSSSSPSLADAARGILDNLKKGGSAVAEKATGAIRAPTGLSSLKSSAAVSFDSPAYLSQLERSYQDDIASTLQYHLILPEQGEVVVSLTLLSDGKVKTVKIIRAESSKNSAYVSRKVKELHFPSFQELFRGEKDHTFVITLCNK